VNLRIYGPLLFATMLFIISSAIKLLLFTGTDVIFDLAPEFTLWSVGLLFAISVSENSLLAGRVRHVYERDENQATLLIRYQTLPPQNLNHSPRFLYFFVYAMMVWILTILMMEQAKHLNELSSKDCYHLFFIVGAIFLSGTTVGLSIFCLKEVEQ
jgi:hypothetical protein